MICKKCGSRDVKNWPFNLYGRRGYMIHCVRCGKEYFRSIDEYAKDLKEEKEMTNDQLQKEILKEKLAQLKSMKEDSNKPSLTVYLLLALFLGGVGAHDFYVGKPVTGLIKLVFCWTGIPTIISLFNIIGALMNKQNFK